MTEHDENVNELAEARAALAGTHSASVRTDAAVVRALRAGRNIAAIVDPNGYVERFRTMIRGA